LIPRGAAAGLNFVADEEAPGFVLGTWEPRVQQQLAEILAPGQVVYDLGAASGFYTLIAARAVTRDGLVVAIEPLPSNVARLRRNLDLNELGNVHVLAVAVSDQPGHAIVGGRTGDPLQAVVSEAGDGTAVEVVTLDGLIESSRIPPPALVKIDVEGDELAILRGARHTLGQHRPLLLIEVHDTWRELRALLAELGYDWSGVELADPEEATEPTHVVARPR
jgi:FkbM family methyltransferase